MTENREWEIVPTEEAAENAVASETAETITVPPERFTGVDALFAWACLVGGYAFCRAHPAREYPFGGFMLILALFAVTAVIAAVRGVKLRWLPTLAAVASVAVAGGLLTVASDTLHSVAYVYALGTYTYYVYTLYAEEGTTGFSDRWIVDRFKAVAVMPFCSFGCVFAALFSGKMKYSGKQLGKILLGVGAAIVPTVIAVNLLSYDAEFSQIMDRLFDVEFETVMKHIGSAILGVPIAMYLFGLYVSSMEQKGKAILPTEQCARVATSMRVVPQVTVAVAALPLLFLYGVFFASQWEYYMSAFTGVLPSGFSYADYAREGFFQLCTVAVINFLAIVAMLTFMKRTDTRSRLLTILVTSYAVCTLILIATALSKMVLYIDSYGLTPKRVYASWFMIVLVLAFLIITLGRFVRRVPAAAVCGVMTVVMFAALVLGGVDSGIARYNVNRYLDGSLKTVDVAMMETLGDAAIPALVDLYEAQERELAGETVSWKTSKKVAEHTQLRNYLQQKRTEYASQKNSLWMITVPRLRAEAALETPPWW